MKYKKCEKCGYKGRRSTVYPCSACEENQQEPITCFHCRWYQCGRHGYGENKSIMPCEKFLWD